MTDYRCKEVERRKKNLFESPSHHLASIIKAFGISKGPAVIAGDKEGAAPAIAVDELNIITPQSSVNGSPTNSEVCSPEIGQRKCVSHQVFVTVDSLGKLTQKHCAASASHLLGSVRREVGAKKCGTRRNWYNRSVHESEK